VVVFVTISLALLMMSLDSTIVATALHSLQHDLGTSVNWAGWTITAYALGFVLVLPLSGSLSDRYGRRRVFVGSLVVFTLASLGCGLVSDVYALIALRAIQAAGGAGFTPSATGIVVDHFGDARDRAVSLFGSIFPIGAMIGPIFGGLFVTYWSWRGVFFVNVPVGIAVLVLCLRYIPRDRPRPRSAHLHMDAAGMALLGAGILAGMLAASYLGEPGASAASALFLVLVVVAVAAIWLFIRHVHRTAWPFIAPRLIHGPGFGEVNLVNGIIGGVTIGTITLIPLYATNRYGLDALDAGTLLVAQGAAAIVFSVAATLALRRTGYRLPLSVGIVAIVAGIGLLAIDPPAGIGAYGWLAGSAFLVGVGSGLINPPSRNAGLQLAPERAATIAALRTLSLQVGAIVTVSVTTAIIAGSAAPGSVQARIYLVTALLVAAASPLVARIPEHRGAW
jgi:EmrB/QacA subfamily drug resistance transporter